MLLENETLVKDIEFNCACDESLVKIISEYKKVYKGKKKKKLFYTLIEIALLIVLSILDFMKINVSLLLGALCIIMFMQYLNWGFRKIAAINQHYDLGVFIDGVKKELNYIEVICDDIARDRKNGYVALFSTLDGFNIMEKIIVPYVDRLSVDFDRNNEKEKPHMYIIKSGVMYFAIESLDSIWWEKNIQKIL